MTMPHQCRCAICGEIGTIVPGLPNVFAQPAPTPQPDFMLASKEFADAITGLDKSGPITAAVCTHGYTRCMPCKFPPPEPPK